MSSTTEATTGQLESQGSETPSETARKPATTRRQPKATLVKAETETPQVFVLADHTRLVQTDTLPNHRPIALSELEVVGSLNASGTRPIMANTLEIFSTDLLPGHRPVMVSTLPISDVGFLLGNRPIAPNDVVDPPAPVLMGYLD